MGKRPLGGNLARHAGDHHRDHGARRCLSCHRPIVYGDRCPSCTRELVARRRRKRR